MLQAFFRFPCFPCFQKNRENEKLYSYHSAKHQILTRTTDCNSKLISKLLKFLNKEHRPIPNFSTQYALAIPGTSTEVEIERLFSIIKDVWGPQEGHLDPKTLEAHLDIKLNWKKSCSEFFNAVKFDKKLLS